MVSKVCAWRKWNRGEKFGGKIFLSFVMKKKCAWRTLGIRKNAKKKGTFSAGGNETEIDFASVGKENRKYLRDVKVIP